jgi:predicted metalloprotease
MLFYYGTNANSAGYTTLKISTTLNPEILEKTGTIITKLNIALSKSGIDESQYELVTTRFEK